METTQPMLTAAEPINLDNESIPDLNTVDPEIIKLISDAYNHAQTLVSKKAQTVGQLNALKATVSEWMDAYYLIGFDIDGNPSVISNCNNQKDKRALSNLFISVFKQVMNED